MINIPYCAYDNNDESICINAEGIYLMINTEIRLLDIRARAIYFVIIEEWGLKFQLKVF